MKKLEDQAEAAIKAQTEAKEKADSAEAIKKVAESQRKEAKEKMAQAEKELQEALATKDAEIKEADEKTNADDIPLPFPPPHPPAQSDEDSESEDEEEDDALVRKVKEATASKSPPQNEQVLDLTHDEEVEEVPKDVIPLKVSSDSLLADKSIDETLAQIDAEIAVEKAAEVSSQQSSDVQSQPAADVGES
ncbi:glutamic acid-rich protein-like [Camellia sinensis]|uniref:glutamic acid-rich protein-like n=1 Tax=Camellia sinensis TaxID=4442 RepID=UPI001035F091|nr:glutamic acid-rich protein-like [Camellia sinensis]